MGNNFRLDGVDGIRRKLQDMADRARAIDGHNEIPFSELFNDAFMRQYTDFPTLDAMFAASGFTVNSAEDFAKIPDAEWEQFVRQNTRFGTWKEMQEKAAAGWVSRRLGFSQ